MQADYALPLDTDHPESGFPQIKEAARRTLCQLPEAERVIGFDTPDGYDCDVWEETPGK